MAVFNEQKRDNFQVTSLFYKYYTVRDFAFTCTCFISIMFSQISLISVL